MKKNLLLKSVFIGALGLAMITPTASAHDVLDDVSIEKGAEAGSLAVIPQLEGSKNVSGWNEVAAVQLKEKDGVQNNTADVYAHKNFAYVGTHTSNGGNGGVRVFDLKDPSNPIEVASFGDEIPGTWQEKVVVKQVNTKDFTGDLAAVSVQRLDRSNPDSVGGVLLYDVTDPYHPKKLGFWAVDQRASGTHELYLAKQGDRAFVLAASNYADYYTHGEKKDFSLVEVTDPANPKTIYEFDPRQLDEVPDDFNGYHWNAPDGKVRPVFNHSVMTDENAQTAFLSFWDLGTIMLDISDPDNPEYLGRTEFASLQQGSAHSAQVAKGGTVLIETREVYAPKREGYEESYGYTRIFDIKDRSNPKLLSDFKTDLVDNVEDGVTFANTVHDPKVVGNTLYLSHYAGGVRAVDISDPSKPEEIGRYVPENSFVWGVFANRNYILASDMGTGLKVIQKNNKSE
ncbi:MAG: LVIVD repeat-containing protein [Bacillota bacterium]|uniref:LVIVD repeat-containing protein n=1 Tax=Rossellomorea TaxID=2837508 RepID=UPI0005C7F310|nr:hypothetical protein [Rossellomorea aquimaris]